MARSKAGRPANLERRKTGPGFAFSDWLHRNLDTHTDLSNEELAEKMGYSRPNIISMWKTGRAKVPLDRLLPLCELLNVEMITLLPLWLEQYLDADGFEKVNEAVGRLVTKQEAEVVGMLREASDNSYFELIEEKTDQLLSCFRIFTPDQWEAKKEKERAAFYASDPESGMF